MFLRNALSQVVGPWPSGLIVTDPEFRILQVSDDVTCLFGYDIAQLLGQKVTALIPKFRPPLSEAHWQGTEETPRRYIYENTFEGIHCSGEGLPLYASAFASTLAGTPVAQIFLIDLRDLHERSERYHTQLRALEQTADLIMITNSSGRIEYVNPAFEEHTGYKRSEVIGKRSNLLKSGHHADNFYRQLWRGLRGGEVFRGILVNRKKSGDLFHEEKTISPIKDEEGNIVSFVSTAKDVTERVQAASDLLKLATLDPVTDLPNRHLFNQWLHAAIGSPEGVGGALLYVDLDQFKSVNDTFGHAFGDLLLKAVSERLSALKNDSVAIARLGGDEFGILLTACETFEHAARVASLVLGQFHAPFVIGDLQTYVTPSIGITLFPDQAGDAMAVFKNADIAMYAAKARGRARYEFFTQEMAVRLNARHHLENALRHALVRGELTLAYQPQYDFRTGNLVGAEALLRWSPLEVEPVPISEVIAILEETGWILEVGEWILRQACKDAAFLQQFGIGISIAINVSAKQFQDSNFVSLAEQIFQETGVNPEGLDFEITESVLINETAGINLKLARLSALGVRIALDDFGTGYSSLSYLKRYLIDVLKIDRSFVVDSVEDASSLAIVRAIVAIAVSLGLETVAEGVETAEQHLQMAHLGCDFFQGNFASHPIDIHALAVLAAGTMSVGGDQEFHCRGEKAT